MIRVDDRDIETLPTHTILWGGTDRFLSGRGLAKDGASYAFWACKPEDSNACESWVRSRGGMLRVREVGCRYHPKARGGHCHIYVWSKR